MITRQQGSRRRPGTGGPVGRVLAGLAASLALVMAVVGVPWILIELAGNPLPDRLDLRRVWVGLTSPDDGTVLVGLIAIIAWIAWLVFAVSTLAEVVAVLSRQRIRIRLPGLGGVQKVAGGLVLLVLGMFVAPGQLAAADPALSVPSVAAPARPSAPGPADPTTPGPAGNVSIVRDADPGETRPASRTDGPGPGSPPNGAGQRTGSGAAAGSLRRDGARPGSGTDGWSGATRTDGPGHRSGSGPAGDPSGRPAGRPPVSGETIDRVHVVRAGDDLWSLAEQFYGRGQDWRRISRANPDVLTGGPDRLTPGWRLIIPGVSADALRIRVRPGDTLSAIADREYGDAGAWTRIFDANRGVLTDPDLLPVGLQLVIPNQSDTSAPDSRAVPDTGARPETARNAGSRRPNEKQPVPSPGTSTTAGPGSSAGPASSAGTAVPAAPASPAAPAPTAADASPDSTAPTAVPSAKTPVGESAGGSGQRSDQDLPTMPAGLVGVGGVLAAALTAGLFARRQLQLRARPSGRRIPHPAPPARHLEAGLGRRRLVLGLSQLDRALRAIGRDCLRRGVPVSTLLAVRLSEQQLSLIMKEPDGAAPIGFTVDENTWRLAADDAAFLFQDDAVGDCPQPYPALVSVGTDADGSVIMINIEAAGLLGVVGSGNAPDEALTAMINELAFVPWSDELVITVVGDQTGLIESVDHYNIGSVGDLDQLLRRWRQRAALQREHLRHNDVDGVRRSPIDYRVNPDLADPWVPELAVIRQPPTPAQAEELQQLLLSEPRVGMSAVFCGEPPAAGWRLRLGGDADDRITAELNPFGWTFDAQVLGPPAAELVQQLLDSTGSDQTDPAPWWTADFPPGTPGPARADAGSRTAVVLDHDQQVDQPRPTAADRSWPSPAVRLRGNVVAAESDAESDDRWSRRAPAIRRGTSEEIDIVPSPFAASPPPTPRHPTLMLLGPIDLLGAAGRRPSRAVLQCIEYAAWLLEHPGSTAHAMAAGLVVAEGTRRSNVSRLRSWLGSDDQGEPYLPDAYSGRIVLSAMVSSDWHRLQILTGTGVNVTSTEGLCRALELVRGAPLADAAPTQWHWAEEMRTDMVSVIRDIAVEVTERALSDSDVELARWAASRGLTAAPQDEFLMGARIRTEFQAGNPAEVERLALQLAAQGRALGVDLHPDTVDLLQQVMEGRLRARA